MYIRKQLEVLESRICEPRGKIQVLSGARQIGKSTLIAQLLERIDMPHLAVSADNVMAGDTEWISNRWNTVRALMRAGGHKEMLLVIDEVHKVDNWSEAVKMEWDADTMNHINIKVVLLGSSRLLVKDGLTESLMGRYEIIRMPHWSYKEMHEAFGMNIDQYVFFGGYPGSAAYIKDERRWKRYLKDSIIAPAIEQDVLKTKRVAKPELMRQLFELGCRYSGEELSLNKMLGQLQDAGNVTTMSSYLTTLNESRLLCGMQKYAADQARRYNSSPKFMVYNTALLSAMSGTTFMKALTAPEAWGRWVESAVGAHLLNMADDIDAKVYYWRERNEEVDFIVECDSQLIAIEVKSGRRTMNTGLSIFRQKFHTSQSFVVGSGGMPLEDFLSCNLETLL